MLNPTEKQKIKSFLADKVMSNAVKSVLMDSFLKNSKNTDVQTLAAERIALNLLDEGFKELNKYANKTERTEKKVGQFAL